MSEKRTARRCYAAILLLFAVALAGCPGGDATPAQPTPEVAEATATLEPAAAPTSTPTSESTSTPNPTTTGTPVPTPTAAPDEAVVLITDPVDMELVRVPEGESLMGSDPDEDPGAGDDEQPQHTITLDEFYIGKHEVTNEQYAAFVEATGHDVPSHWEGNSVPAGEENHPVRYVSWNDAVAFTQWLSEETGTEFRLCTEAEWEKACRGTTGLIYPWGDTFDASMANAYQSDIGTTTQVGRYSPAGDSPYGMTDMAGNVWEWVADWYDRDYYHSSPSNNPEGPQTGDWRVMRGSSFYFGFAWYARCASRYYLAPGARNVDVGFRVCVSPGLSSMGLRPHPASSRCAPSGYIASLLKALSGTS